MPVVSRRKRLHKRKGSRPKKKAPSDEISSENIVNTVEDSVVSISNLHVSEENESVARNSSASMSACHSPSTSSAAQVSDHDYGQSPTSVIMPCNDGKEESNMSVASGRLSSGPSSSQVYELFFQVKQKLEVFLPYRWQATVDNNVLHVFYISIQNTVSVQRDICVSATGEVKINIHCQPVDDSQFVNGLDPPIPLEKESINDYVDRIASVVNNVRALEVCSGYDEVKYSHVWTTCPYGEIDKNPYQECRYIETFRSPLCKRLVGGRKWRCSECVKLYGPLRRRAKAAAEEERHPNTGNKFLTEDQMLKKLQDQRASINNLKKQNYRLQERMQEIIKKKAVDIDGVLSDDLMQIMKASDKINPAQSIFLQQQIKASQQRNASGMRWHPTMIRFALALHITSPSAYELVRDTGIVKLPSSRTLFDYSHVKPVSEGIDSFVVSSVEERVNKFIESESHKKYFVLMADEMSVSQNLVFQKSNGRMIGYTSLDGVEHELKNLEQIIDDVNKDLDSTLASKVLVFMIKGVSNGIKEVVAIFSVGNLSANQLKIWTWKVIRTLENCGIRVIALVSDGSSVNRAFIKKNTPATIHPSGVIFDTWNKAARGRKLFFIADVPHLLKTLRNCLLNSRWDGKKSRRRMMKKGKKISWDFIIKLYEAKKNKTLRKSYKLNPMSVYPDSYARMKVSLAAHVLSKTVSVDLRHQGWAEASETANFLELVNDWFDCLNGAHSSMGRKKRNANLDSYTSPTDERFQKLDDFIDYLDSWESEAKSQHVTFNASSADISVNVDAPGCLDDSEIEDVGVKPDDTPASKRLLSRETIEGVKMTTFAFKPMIEFLLQEGVSFVNARVFTQDPLEQFFSKLRAGQGGSTHPNVGQILLRHRAIHTIGQMGMRKRKGNSGEASGAVKVTNTKLAKRESTRVPKFASK